MEMEASAPRKPFQRSTSRKRPRPPMDVEMRPDPEVTEPQLLHLAAEWDRRKS